jgi:hypothetical protein
MHSHLDLHFETERRIVMPNEHDQQSPPDITQQPVIDTAGQSGNQQDTSSPPPTLADISNTLWNLSRNVPTLSAADVKATTDDLLSNLKENSSYNEVQENYSKKYSNLLSS